MISRRHLRSKALQAIYAYFQSHNTNVESGEKELLYSIQKIYELYLYQISFVVELFEYARASAEEAKKKHLPTADDLNPNPQLANNLFIQKINHLNIHPIFEKNHIHWTEDKSLIRKIYDTISEEDKKNKNWSDENSFSFEKDKEFVIRIYENYILPSDLFDEHYEEKSIYWTDDLEIVNSMALKTLSFINENSIELNLIKNVFKNDDDKQFVMSLFFKTIENQHDYRNLIAEKTKNWEADRIALIDMYIMLMAITEILHFPTIPVKVSINEYIDISKRYSSQKSKLFVNGILDTLAIDFKRQNKIMKDERGMA